MPVARLVHLPIFMCGVTAMFHARQRLCCCLFLSPRFTSTCLDLPTLGLYSPLSQHPARRQEHTEKPCGQEKQHKRYEVVPRKSEAMDKPKMSPLGSCHHPILYMSDGRYMNMRGTIQQEEQGTMSPVQAPCLRITISSACSVSP